MHQPLTKWCNTCVATIVKEELELAATIVEEKLELVVQFLPINRHRERAAKFEQRERERAVAKGSSPAAIAAATSAAMRAGSRVRVK